VNCILIWLDGGPSHYETFDPKPEAPADIRGEFKSIQTAIPGVHFSETLPTLAKIANKFAVVRSICHKDPNHGGGNHYMMTGAPTPVPVACGAFVTFHPSFGSVVSWQRGQHEGLPPYVSTVLNGAQRLFLIDPTHLHVALYEGSRDHWTRRMLTDRPELILSALPRRAMAPPSADAVASSRQLATLLKILDLPANHELPALHGSAVSQLIDRVVLAKILPPIAADFEAWIKAGPSEKAA
jgi:hypothetical protein